MAELNHEQQQELERWVELVRQGKTIRRDHRYNMELHEWGFDKAKQDFYHKVVVAAPGGEERLTYGEQELRQWLGHWVSIGEKAGTE